MNEWIVLLRLGDGFDGDEDGHGAFDEDRDPLALAHTPSDRTLRGS